MAACRGHSATGNGPTQRWADRPPRDAVRRPARRSWPLSVVSPDADLRPLGFARGRGRDRPAPAGAGRRSDRAGAASVPYPILMTIGGLVLSLVLSLVPGAPQVSLAPEIVFLLFLPPILSAAYFTSPHELKVNAGRSACWRWAWCWSPRSRWASWCIRWCRRWAGRRPRPGARSSRRQMRCLPRRSHSGSVCRGAWSPSWRARAWSMTRRRWWRCASPSSRWAGAPSVPQATFGFVGVSIGGVACGLVVVGCRPGGEAPQRSTGGCTRIPAGAVCGLDSRRVAAGLGRAVGGDGRNRAGLRRAAR